MNATIGQEQGTCSNFTGRGGVGRSLQSDFKTILDRVSAIDSILQRLTKQERNSACFAGGLPSIAAIQPRLLGTRTSARIFAGVGRNTLAAQISPGHPAPGFAALNYIGLSEAGARGNGLYLPIWPAREYQIGQIPRWRFKLWQRLRRKPNSYPVNSSSGIIRGSCKVLCQDPQLPSRRSNRFDRARPPASGLRV